MTILNLQETVALELLINNLRRDALAELAVKIEQKKEEFIRHVEYTRRMEEKKKQEKILRDSNKDFISSLTSLGCREHTATRLLSENPETQKVGLWKITGEDPNPDMGGSHIRPEIGIVEGTYQKACEYAVQQNGFFQWGYGGDVVKYNPPDKKKILKL